MSQALIFGPLEVLQGNSKVPAVSWKRYREFNENGSAIVNAVWEGSDGVTFSEDAISSGNVTKVRARFATKGLAEVKVTVTFASGNDESAVWRYLVL